MEKGNRYEEVCREGATLPSEESKAENNQTKENRTNKKDLPTYLTTE